MTLSEAEQRLLQLAECLDRPFTPRGDPDAVAMALGHRARSLYRGYLLSSDAEIFTAARALLRPMVEANILLRFIREEPNWRSRLWQAESIRVWMGLADQLRNRPLPAEQKVAYLPSDEEVAKTRADLKQLREDATEAGVYVPKGRLIPDVQEQAQILNTTEVWQAYVVAYMPLTFDQHVSHGSFRDAVHQVLDDESVIHIDSDKANFPERLLASTAFASTLVVVSTWLELGVEDQVSELQERLVRATGDDI
jgi:hypothetical protein